MSVCAFFSLSECVSVGRHIDKMSEKFVTVSTFLFNLKNIGFFFKQEIGKIEKENSRGRTRKILTNKSTNVKIKMGFEKL